MYERGWMRVQRVCVFSLVKVACTLVCSGSQVSCDTRACACVCVRAPVSVTKSVRMRVFLRARVWRLRARVSR